MNTRLAVLFMLIALAAFVFPSCDDSTEPKLEIETLASFRIAVPDTVTTGESFSLTVTAVGDQGTRPFDFDGYVVLTASDGSVTPDSLALAGGTGSGQVVLSGSDETQTITATSGKTTGSVVVNARFMTVLAGDPGESANEAIPSFEFVADGGNYSNNHPSLPGAYVSFNTIMVAFELGTTVGEANAILGPLKVQIVGGVPGEEGVSPGVIFLKLTTSTHAELETVIATLDADAHVNTVIQDALVSSDEIPRPNDGEPPLWTWSNTPGGANWGLERIRVPQMWNLNDAVAKKMANGPWPPSTVLIVDEGFALYHEDLYNLNARGTATSPHGTHVAGVIGATYDNGLGIDGINPFVYMMGRAAALDDGGDPYASRMSAGQAIISGLYHGVRAYTDVVNMSFGYSWADAGIDSDNDAAAQNIVAKQAQMLVNTLHLGRLSIRSPLIVVSAGNDSDKGFGHQDARYNSPMCYAAIELGVQNILVVEAVEDSPGTANGDVTRYPESSINGHVSAPGQDVWGTTSEASLYRSGDGTSYAAAIVSGLAAYIRVLENYITFDDLRDVILSNALSAGGGAQPRIDAWASVVDVDRVRGGTEVLEMMCDVDDGSVDGNQRIRYTDGAEYRAEDIDADNGIGDGRVDMSDFRRWRDWYLSTQSAITFDLNGAANHPKKDVNGNGVVEDAAGESVYPRGDFNGDGRLDLTATSYVPGAVGADATDLDVFRAVFDDPDYSGSELTGLIESADIALDLAAIMSKFGATSATLDLWDLSGLVKTQVISNADPSKVITVPVVPSGYEVWVRIEGITDRPRFDFGHDMALFTLEAGEDVWFEPVDAIVIDPKESFLHVCSVDAGAVDAQAYSLAGMGFQAGDYMMIDQVGHFDGGGGHTNMEGMIAVFSTTNTLLSKSRLNRVPGAIDAGEDFWTEPTFDCGGEATDIAEDFSCHPYVIIKVPTGAKYVFIAAADVKYSDNVNTEYFGVQISRIWTKDLN